MLRSIIELKSLLLRWSVFSGVENSIYIVSLNMKNAPFCKWNRIALAMLATDNSAGTQNKNQDESALHSNTRWTTTHSPEFACLLYCARLCSFLYKLARLGTDLSLQKSQSRFVRDWSFHFIIKFVKVCHDIAEYAALQSRITEERNVQFCKVSIGIDRYLCYQKRKAHTTALNKLTHL